MEDIGFFFIAGFHIQYSILVTNYDHLKLYSRTVRVSMDQRNNYHVNDIKDAYNLIQRNVQHETLMTKMAAEVSTPANYVM